MVSIKSPNIHTVFPRSRYGHTRRAYCQWLDLYGHTINCLEDYAATEPTRRFAESWRSFDFNQKLEVLADLLRPRFLFRDMIRKAGFSRAQADYILSMKNGSSAHQWIDIHLINEGSSVNSEQTVSGIGVWHVLAMLHENRHLVPARRGSTDYFSNIVYFCDIVHPICKQRFNEIIGSVARMDQAVASFFTRAGVIRGAA